MGRVGDYIRPYSGRIAGGMTVKFLGTMMDLVIPWLLAYIIDTLMPTGNRQMILLFGVLMAICSVIAVTFNVGANRMAARVSRDITQELRHDLFEHILYLPASQRDEFSTSSLISRLTNDTYHVHQVIEKMQRLGVRAPLLVLGGMIFTFLLEPSLAMILVLLAPVLALVVWLVTRKGIPLYKQVTERVDSLVRIVRENAAGIRVIKALGKSDREMVRFEAANASVREAEQAAGVVMATTGPTMTLLLNTGFMLVILLGAFRVDLGLTQPGQIIAFLSYFTIILNAVLSVMKIFTHWSRGSASSQRISQVLNAPREMPLEPSEICPECPHISFEKVSFSYGGAVKNLDNISFSLERGETLGIIGPTGSGKSTLVSLLMRFYDPDEGAIYLDGENLGGVEPERLRPRFGAAFQNDVLLAESVYENISFLRGISREEVERAAKAAQIHDFILSLPGGYDAPLDIRGANLSGGQKQRILIARALAGGPEILVLDDAQSALDYQTDAALRRAIREGYRETTTIIVSQRISAILGADLILLLEEGRLLDAGTHDQLIARCDSYRKIAEIQMGGGVA